MPSCPRKSQNLKEDHKVTLGTMATGVLTPLSCSRPLCSLAHGRDRGAQAMAHKPAGGGQSRVDGEDRAPPTSQMPKTGTEALSPQTPPCCARGDGNPTELESRRNKAAASLQTPRHVPQLSLFTAVVFCEVTVNSQLPNTEPSLLGTDRVSVSPWSQHFHNCSVHNVTLHMFLFKDTVFNLYC